MKATANICKIPVLWISEIFGVEIENFNEKSDEDGAEIIENISMGNSNSFLVIRIYVIKSV